MPVLLRYPQSSSETSAGHDHAEYFESVVEKTRTVDQLRVDEWQDALLSSRDMGSWCEWLRLGIEIDILKPKVRREVLVSPHVTFAVSNDESWEIRCSHE